MYEFNLLWCEWAALTEYYSVWVYECASVGLQAQQRRIDSFQSRRFAFEY